MELKEAIEVFERLEARRYEWKSWRLGPDEKAGEVNGESFTFRHSPIYNVRLDAMTTREICSRSFRIFVRVDEGCPSDQRTEALGFVVEVAAEFGLESIPDNGGIGLM